MYRAEWWSISQGSWLLDYEFSDLEEAIEFSKDETKKGNTQRVVEIKWSSESD